MKGMQWSIFFKLRFSVFAQCIWSMCLQLMFANINISMRKYETDEHI